MCLTSATGMADWCWRPISSHRKQIGDFASWNGLLVMTGVGRVEKESNHVYRAKDDSEALWLGGIDDLWKLGKPVGVGGPWKNTKVRAGETSDPYLMTGYDNMKVILTVDQTTEITLQINFDHHGYHTYERWNLNANEPLEFEFPKGFSAHWARLVTDRDFIATATFVYE